MLPRKKKTRSYHSDVRKAEAAATRISILKAAQKLLTHGPRGTPFSLENVASAAGVTRLTVYNQFKSRGGLLEALLDEMARVGGLSELRSTVANPEPLKALQGTVAVFCGFWAQHRNVLPRLRALMARDAQLGDRLGARNERRRDLLMGVVARLPTIEVAQRADLVDTLYAVTAFEFFDAVAGETRSREETERLIQMTVEDLLAGVVARGRKRQRMRSAR